jgi:hypothetical protein
VISESDEAFGKIIFDEVMTGDWMTNRNRKAMGAKKLFYTHPYPTID